ncbi:MAG: efflux RND transporter periplasmic adaptor subunit [Chthoniobacteraceae bacterium]
MVLYNVIIIASISTIFFNANPLMRFDGYYILTDLMEVPNLQTKSRALIGYQVKKLLFGNLGEDPTLSRMPLPKRRFWLFYCYAILSFLYGYWVIYKLTAYMSPHLKPYGLEDLSNYLSTLALVAWVVVPFLGFFKELKLTMEDWKTGGRLRRLSLIGGVAAVLLGLFCFWPKQLKIERSLVVELARPEVIRGFIIGRIKEVYVHEGQIVPPGAPLALLENRAVETQYISRRNQVKIDDILINQAMGTDKPADLRTAQTDKLKDQSALDQASLDRADLVLRSQSGGTVLNRDLEKRVGEMLKTGDIFAMVAPLDRMLIKVPLSEHEVRWVKKGQSVGIKLSAYPGVILHGVIEEDPAVYIQGEMPAAFSERREGDVRTGTNIQGKELPLDRTYEAVVKVDNSSGLLRPNMTGRAWIDAGRHPFGRLFYQSLLDLLSLDYRF